MLNVIIDVTFLQNFSVFCKIQATFTDSRRKRSMDKRRKERTTEGKEGRPEKIQKKVIIKKF